MIFNVGGVNGMGQLPDFDFDGEWNLINDGKEEHVQNWRLMLKSCGTITFNRLSTPVDIFCVGGGGGGCLHGGGGGYTATTKGQVLQTGRMYTVTVGGGGEVSSTTGMRGGTTSFDSILSAEGGYGGYSSGNRGGDGGSGGGNSGGFGKAGNGGNNGSDGMPNYVKTQVSEGLWEWVADPPAGQGQDSTTGEFGDPSAALYAGGGGGGCNQVAENDGGYGGVGGGGHGAGRGPDSTALATEGGINTGGGGGGGTTALSSMPGGCGIIIIRNHR